MIDSPEPDNGREEQAQASRGEEKAASSVTHKAEPQKAGALDRSSDEGKSAGLHEREQAASSPASLDRAVKAAPLKVAAVSGGDHSVAEGSSASSAPQSTGTQSEQSVPSVNELKEKIMASQANDTAQKMTSGMSEAVSDMQDRSKAAYEKSTEMMAEMSDFAKGTAEAMVESTKVLAGAMQDMGRTYADEAKSAYEQMTADLKEMAAVKNPTELFQLQGKIMRRNFDALVSTTSKNAEMLMKLSNDAFAPLSARMNAAADKMSKGS